MTHGLELKLVSSSSQVGPIVPYPNEASPASSLALETRNSIHKRKPKESSKALQVG